MPGPTDNSHSFAKRICPAPKEGGFYMPSQWTWCGSVMKDEEGKHQLFAAQWPHELPFFKGYVAHSRIVRAEAEEAEGPYTYCEDILPPRGEEWWDGRMTHNPTVCRYGSEYLLFYIGATYEGPDPTADELREDNPASRFRQTYRRYRIGMARASSLSGPWKRSDRPLLEPRPDKWDHDVVTNPAPCVLDDGSILLYYRSNTSDGLRIGLAKAASPDHPFERVCDDPILQFENGGHVEDPFVWQEDERFCMLAKDMTGVLTGEKHAGVFLESHNAIDWQTSANPKAYSRTILWDDGSTTTQGCLERPQLLFEDGRPTCLFAATGDGPGGFDNCTRTWNVAIPLR